MQAVKDLLQSLKTKVCVGRNGCHYLGGRCKRSDPLKQREVTSKKGVADSFLRAYSTRLSNNAGMTVSTLGNAMYRVCLPHNADFIEMVDEYMVEHGVVPDGTWISSLLANHSISEWCETTKFWPAIKKLLRNKEILISQPLGPVWRGERNLGLYFK